MNTTITTTTEAAAAGSLPATSAPTIQKWEAGTIGPRMLGKFNEALKAVNWNAKGVKTLRGIIGKPETQKEDGCIMVSMFGGAQHPEYAAKVCEIQAAHGHVVTADNYKALTEALNALARWFKDNPMVNDERITQEEHDAKEAAYSQAMADRKRKDEEHEAAKAIIVGELRAKYPWAMGRRASENLKTLLGQTFPGILFSVRSDSSSLTASWENGPSEEEVRNLSDQFREGSFNGMTDSFDYDYGARKRAWAAVMGTVRYVSCNRTVDRQPVLDGLKASIATWDADGHHSASQVAYRLIAKTSFPAGAVLTGVERIPGVDCGQMEDWFKITYTAPEPAPGGFQAAAAAPVVGASGIVVSRNVEKGGVEIRFPAKPEAAMIDRVKSAGFRWSRFSGCWWAKASDYKVRFAYELAGQEMPKDGAPAAPEAVRDPGEDAADRWAEMQHGLACNA